MFQFFSQHSHEHGLPAFAILFFFVPILLPPNPTLFHWRKRRNLKSSLQTNNASEPTLLWGTGHYCCRGVINLSSLNSPSFSCLQVKIISCELQNISGNTVIKNKICYCYYYYHYYYYYNRHTAPAPPQPSVRCAPIYKNVGQHSSTGVRDTELTSPGLQPGPTVRLSARIASHQPHATLHQHKPHIFRYTQYRVIGTTAQRAEILEMLGTAPLQKLRRIKLCSSVYTDPVRTFGFCYQRVGWRRCGPQRLCGWNSL
jgi:hypothetical protein